MKATCMQSNYRPVRRTPCRYPNSATRRYYLERLLDAALAAAITVAVVVILMFLLILF